MLVKKTYFAKSLWVEMSKDSASTFLPSFINGLNRKSPPKSLCSSHGN